MNYKLDIVAGMGVLTAAALGYYFSWFALTNSYNYLIPASVIALLYIALLTLRVLIIEKPWVAAGFIALDLIVFTASFAYNLSLWLFAGAAAAGIWLFLAWRAGRASLQNMVRLRLGGLSHGFIRSSFRALLFLCIATYFSLINPSELAISRAFIASSIQSAIGGANNGIIEKITGRTLNEGQKSELREHAVNAFHAAGSELINRVPAAFRSALLIGLGIIVFLLISSITTFLVPLVMGFVWCFIQLLLRINFINIQTEKVQKEIITII